MTAVDMAAVRKALKRLDAALTKLPPESRERLAELTASPDELKQTVERALEMAKERKKLLSIRIEAGLFDEIERIVRDLAERQREGLAVGRITRTSVVEAALWVGLKELRHRLELEPRTEETR